MFIVHGDLKRDNILVSDDHRTVIADFGIFSVIGATTFGTSLSSRKGGTVRWQAREALNVSPNSFPADVYSLACVYVSDGSMPWNGQAECVVILQKKHLPCPRHLSENDLWWELMVRCWTYEPSLGPTLLHLMEHLHVTGDALPPPEWDKPDLAWLPGPLVQGKLHIPSDLPSLLNVEDDVSCLSDPGPERINPN
ncbi:kinase-like domain-containing protein [Armillaria luteobubalina]|uniref:Kinase-like domain-containing protein n=1 Tax=Armillaria luteobubalina TaxID=153913 RepID=A0AA39UT76_9AGAR|nr:kinase-like domain-containing protein [Armillaria luteobubalina]